MANKIGMGIVEVQFTELERLAKRLPDGPEKRFCQGVIAKTAAGFTGYMTQRQIDRIRNAANLPVEIPRNSGAVIDDETDDTEEVASEDI